MGKKRVGALEKVDADLSNLQYKIRRDPRSYKDDFLNQFGQYRSQRDLFMAAPSSTTSTGIVSFGDLIDFVSHVADCYPEDTADFPKDLKTILQDHHAELESELREKIVGSLVLLRRKNITDSTDLLNTLFRILIATPSKTLRHLLFTKIIADLRTSNAKAKNHKLNATIQKVLRTLVNEDKDSPKALWSTKITREMWKRQIWTDSNAVEIMKEASLSNNAKVVVGGVRFFLGSDKEREEMEDDSSDEEEGIDMGKLKHQALINKKTKKKAMALKAAAQKVKKIERKKNQPDILNFSALNLLHDPQGFAEGLFDKHLKNAKAKLDLEQKLLVLQLVTRLVGLHKLHLISLYPYFTKYLRPQQPSVTSFLASLAQATHSLVPEDQLEPLIQKIANEFVSEASAVEVCSAGLNAIREICVRQPMAINETLLQDLVEYKGSKDKGVSMAAKGLLRLYQEVAPQMLKKKDRGKIATMELSRGEREEMRYGVIKPGNIEGLDLLVSHKAEKRKREGAEAGNDEEVDEAEDDKNWEVASDSDDDSEGWIQVESDGEDIVISDSEDDEPAAKKAKIEKETALTEKEAENAEEALASATRYAETHILTPADLEKLKELRMEAGVNKLTGITSKRRKEMLERHADDPLTAEEIEGLSKLRKSTKEERIALAREGKGDRNEHKSTQAIRQAKKVAEGKSTTNKEKARKKNFLMTLGKAKSKQKRSLTQTKRTLKAHIERSKRGGKRGNIGM